MFAGALITADSAKRAGKETRLTLDDFFVFGGGVLYHEGPGVKLPGDENAGKKGHWLGPDLKVPGGSYIWTEEKPCRVITATTVRPALNDGAVVFPNESEMEVPRELRGRPRKEVREEIARAKKDRGPGRPRKNTTENGAGVDSSPPVPA